MRTLTTNTGTEIKVSANSSKRTFTIKLNGFTYRTNPMTQEDFDSNEYNTANDWQQFLKASEGEYYRVRQYK